MSRKAALQAASIALLAMFAISGCDSGGKSASEAPVDTSAVLATVNGEPITQAAVDNLIAQLPRPVHPDPEKARQLIMEELIRRKVLAQYATEWRLDRKLDVHLSLERQREAVLVGAAHRQILEGAPVITEEQLRERYQQEIERGPKQEYRVRHIIVDSEDAARDIIAQLGKGADFAALAREHSTGPSKDQGGELGWLGPGMVVPEFFAAVETLKAGEYTQQPVHTSFGWHVIEVEETRPLTPAPFDQVKEKIQSMLRQQQFEEKIEELRARADIKITGAGGSDSAPAPDTPAR
jgi:peptidyl-prolyl cis-trans isomerase C